MMQNKTQFILMLIVTLVTSPVVQANDKLNGLSSSPFNIGETITWESKLLKQSRTINVYLPEGYQKSEKKYPVIYLLDGSADEDFIHISGLVQFGSFSWINMIPESIVVGIANVDRKHDFTFPTKNSKDQQDFPTTGSSAQFIEFISQELQPLIANKYRVTELKTLIGQSLGGLLATEILFKHPELFDNYLIVSPSIWWDDESILKLEPKVFAGNKSIFVGVGKEGEIMERGAKQLSQKLTALNWPNARINFAYFEQLDHGDTLHLAAYAGLKFIFENAGL